MAKEQLHNWGRHILLAVVILFAAGGWVVTVRSNTKDIGVLQKDTRELRDDVHALELSDKDIANLAQKSVDFMVKINASLDAITEKLATQALVGAVNSEKLQSLTKD